MRPAAILASVAFAVQARVVWAGSDEEPDSKAEKADNLKSYGQEIMDTKNKIHNMYDILDTKNKIHSPHDILDTKNKLHNFYDILDTQDKVLTREDSKGSLEEEISGNSYSEMPLLGGSPKTDTPSFKESNKLSKPPQLKRVSESTQKSDKAERLELPGPDEHDLGGGTTPRPKGQKSAQQEPVSKDSRGRSKNSQIPEGSQRFSEKFRPSVTFADFGEKKSQGSKLQGSSSSQPEDVDSKQLSEGSQRSRKSEKLRRPSMSFGSYLEKSFQSAQSSGSGREMRLGRTKSEKSKSQAQGGLKLPSPDSNYLKKGPDGITSTEGTSKAQQSKIDTENLEIQKPPLHRDTHKEPLSQGNREQRLNFKTSLEDRVSKTSYEGKQRGYFKEPPPRTQFQGHLGGLGGVIKPDGGKSSLMQPDIGSIFEPVSASEFRRTSETLRQQSNAAARSHSVHDILDQGSMSRGRGRVENPSARNSVSRTSRVGNGNGNGSNRPRTPVSRQELSFAMNEQRGTRNGNKQRFWSKIGNQLKRLPLGRQARERQNGNGAGATASRQQSNFPQRASGEEQRLDSRIKNRGRNLLKGMKQAFRPLTQPMRVGVDSPESSFHVTDVQGRSPPSSQNLRRRNVEPNREQTTAPLGEDAHGGMRRRDLLGDIDVVAKRAPRSLWKRGEPARAKRLEARMTTGSEAGRNAEQQWDTGSLRDQSRNDNDDAELHNTRSTQKTTQDSTGAVEQNSHSGNIERQGSVHYPDGRRVGSLDVLNLGGPSRSGSKEMSREESASYQQSSGIYPPSVDPYQRLLFEDWRQGNAGFVQRRRPSLGRKSINQSGGGGSGRGSGRGSRPRRSSSESIKYHFADNELPPENQYPLSTHARFPRSYFDPNKPYQHQQQQRQRGTPSSPLMMLQSTGAPDQQQQLSFKTMQKLGIGRATQDPESFGPVSGLRRATSANGVSSPTSVYPSISGSGGEFGRSPRTPRAQGLRVEERRRRSSSIKSMEELQTPEEFRKKPSGFGRSLRASKKIMTSSPSIRRISSSSSSSSSSPLRRQGSLRRKLVNEQADSSRKGIFSHLSEQGLQYRPSGLQASDRTVFPQSQERPSRLTPLKNLLDRTKGRAKSFRDRLKGVVRKSRKEGKRKSGEQSEGKDGGGGDRKPGPKRGNDDERDPDERDLGKFFT